MYKQEEFKSVTGKISESISLIDQLKSAINALKEDLKLVSVHGPLSSAI